MAQSGAPRDGDRFVNAAGARPLAGAGEMFPFFLRKIWSTAVGRGPGAPRVAFDPQALQHNPSITWVGHATFLVRMDGVTFLTDPMFSERASPVSFAGPARLVEPGVPLDALPPLDFALVSHDHYDHFDLPTITELARRGVPIFTPLGLGALVREAGGNATELDWWQQRAAGRVRITCVPAQHFSGRSLTDGNSRLWSGWVVEGPTRRFYHSGDTGYFPWLRRDRGAPRPARPRGVADRRLRSRPHHAVRAHESRGGDAGGGGSARRHRGRDALRHVRPHRGAARRAATALPRRRLAARPRRRRGVDDEHRRNPQW
jgi:L-ascorbate metabolism protein UlaG (beta-lactamase superfamily)